MSISKYNAGVNLLDNLMKFMRSLISFLFLQDAVSGTRQETEFHLHSS